MVHITVSIPDETKRLAKVEAAKLNMTFKEFIAAALDEKIEKGKVKV
jgi:hypothetical protein